MSSRLASERLGNVRHHLNMIHLTAGDGPLDGTGAYDSCRET